MTSTIARQGIVASLGGTPEPIIKALLARRPAHALFVVSESSAGDVEDKVLPRLDGYVPQYQKAVVSDPQLLGTCYQEHSGSHRALAGGGGAGPGEGVCGHYGRHQSDVGGAGAGGGGAF